MHYHLVVFGVKDTTEDVLRHIAKQGTRIDLLVTIDPEVLSHNQVSGFSPLGKAAEELGIPVWYTKSYGFKDGRSAAFFSGNSFDLGITSGWQRLIPGNVLGAFSKGIFGFHGNCGYLPFGRGRSPLNWSIILGDSRFNLNLFRYDEEADSPNVFAAEMFQITPYDDIRSCQYKNTILQMRLIDRLLAADAKGDIPIRRESKDYDSWYGKRTAEDGKIDFRGRTREIYNLIRGVSAPFPGAFCYVRPDDSRKDEAPDEGNAAPGSGEAADADGGKVIIWEARPFDEVIDFSGYAPGEVAEVFDGRPIVRTVDGSLLIVRYESRTVLKPGMILE